MASKSTYDCLWAVFGSLLIRFIIVGSADRILVTQVLDEFSHPDFKTAKIEKILKVQQCMRKREILPRSLKSENGLNSQKGNTQKILGHDLTI